VAQRLDEFLNANAKALENLHDLAANGEITDLPDLFFQPEVLLIYERLTMLKALCVLPGPKNILRKSWSVSLTHLAFLLISAVQIIPRALPSVPRILDLDPMTVSL
jgi:hypothetical protein